MLELLAVLVVLGVVVGALRLAVHCFREEQAAQLRRREAEITLRGLRVAQHLRSEAWQARRALRGLADDDVIDVDQDD